MKNPVFNMKSMISGVVTKLLSEPEPALEPKLFESRHRDKIYVERKISQDTGGNDERRRLGSYD
jgi:hypothetical protein